MKKIFTLLFLTSFLSINSQTIFGKWYSTNDDTGEVDSVVEMYKKDGKAYAKIIEIMDEIKECGEE